MESQKGLCEICGEIFSFRKNLYRHMRQSHNLDVKENPGFREVMEFHKALCEICGKAFKLRKTLNRHVKQCHNIERSDTCDESRCNICDKTFSNIAALDRHNKTHNPAYGKVSCTECDFICHLMQDLRNHLECQHRINIERQEIDFDSMENFVQWKEEMEAEDNVSFIKKCGQIDREKSKIYYFCHRSGNSRKAGLGKRLRGPSVKIGHTCPASLTVTKNAQGKVSVLFYRTHTGHSCSLGSLRLTSADRKMVADLIESGLTESAILKKIRDSVHENHFKRVHMLEMSDIYNIKRQYRLDKSRLHENDAISVDLWVQQQQLLGVDSSVIFYKPQGVQHEQLLQNDFMIVLMTPFQTEMAKKFIYDKVLIDSTHGTNKYDFQLTTLMTVDEFGVGCPVTYCLSTRTDVSSMEVFLNAVKEVIGTIQSQVFMSDDCNSYYNAWCRVMGPTAQRLLCTWHVCKSWRRNVRNKVKGDLLKYSVFKAVKTLQLQQDKGRFSDLMQGFLRWCAQNKGTKEFGIYFQAEYAGRPEMWAFCYRLGLGLNTNMYLEALHRTLKHCYFSSKMNSRVDRCIHALLHRTRDLLLERTIRLSKGGLTSGRIAKITQSHRKSQAINENMISSIEDGQWEVISSSTREAYTVAIADSSCRGCPLSCPECKVCVHSYLCSCTDHMIKGNMCKHIHAVVRYTGNAVCISQDSVSRDRDLQETVEMATLQPSSVASTVSWEAAARDRCDILKDMMGNVGAENCRLYAAALDKIIQQASVKISAQKENCAGSQEITAPHFPVVESTEPANKKYKKQRMFESIKKKNVKRVHNFCTPTSEEVVVIEERLLQSNNIRLGQDHLYI